MAEYKQKLPPFLQKDNPPEKDNHAEKLKLATELRAWIAANPGKTSEEITVAMPNHHQLLGFCKSRQMIYVNYKDVAGVRSTIWFVFDGGHPSHRPNGSRRY